MTTGRINQVALLRDARSGVKGSREPRTPETHARAIKQMRASHKRARAHALSQMNKPLMQKQRRAHERRTRQESTKRIDRHATRAPALSCSHCNYSWQTATPEGGCAHYQCAQRFHEGTPCCEPPNNSSPAHPLLCSKGREPEPGVLTRESYRLAIHIVKPHNRFTHCPDKRRAARATPTTGVLLGATDRGINPIQGRRLDARRRKPTAQRRAQAWRKTRREPRRHTSSRRHIEHLPQKNVKSNSDERSHKAFPAIAHECVHDRGRAACGPQARTKQQRLDARRLLGSRLAPLLRRSGGRPPPSSSTHSEKLFEYCPQHSRPLPMMASSAKRPRAALILMADDVMT